ncbi:multiple sugar transport system substrate-binding protein [Paeniglutamicibacter cryotolerans]|uniref:Multiple sugar transport system substrate-binding protein n=2 Tax=Paeniglutamicibacter cryotolerans TaxID=670079 RepID=A0A839QHF0_9MICC|nr:multiple sugar transport system substrate-binding protein [Paeniglutamicibacter cryotolerans]
MSRMMLKARGRGAAARRAVAVILGPVVLSLVASGCVPADSTPVLTWYTTSDDGGQAVLAAQCTQAAQGAYRIRTSGLPTSADAQREQLARRLAASDTSMDIMSLDPPFIPEFAEPGFLAPVPSDIAARTTAHSLAGAKAGASWKGELVAIPFWANTQLLWYRKSVARKAGLDMSQPVSWEQLMDAAQSQDKYLGVQGKRGESMTVWVNALIKGAGGEILANPEAKPRDLSLGLDSPAGTEAARIVSRIGRQALGGPGLPTASENESMLLFQGAKGSFMVNWPFVWPAMNAAVKAGNLNESLPDDIGWAPYPQTVAGTPSAPPLGGIDLGVGSASKHPDLVYRAIECIVSPQNQTEYFLGNGNPPADSTAYEDPRVAEQFPMAPLIRDSLETSAPRPQTPYYSEVSTALQRYWAPPGDVDPATTPRLTGEFILQVLHGERLL